MVILNLRYLDINPKRLAQFKFRQAACNSDNLINADLWILDQQVQVLG